MIETAYIVTVKRRTARDYDVCWCRTLEEARSKFSEFMLSGSPGREVMSVTIEKLVNGKREVINGIARA